MNWAVSYLTARRGALRGCTEWEVFTGSKRMGQEDTSKIKGRIIFRPGHVFRGARVKDWQGF